MEEDDAVDVQLSGPLLRQGSTERAPFRCDGEVPGWARLVSVPEEPGKRFVVLAEAAPGSPFFHCGTDEVLLRTLLHIYGTEEEYEGLPSEQ